MVTSVGEEREKGQSMEWTLASFRETTDIEISGEVEVRPGLRNIEDRLCLRL